MSGNNRWDLSGRSAVVTGGSSGLGIGIARALAAAGARVALVGRDKDRLGAVAAELRASGAEVEETVADLAPDGAVGEVVDSVVSAFGTIDILVNNAGIYRNSAFVDTPLEDFDEQWRVNVRVPFALTQAAVPHMGDGSSVVFIGSNLGDVGSPGSAPYCATKAAVHSLTQTLALELAPRIRVNAVAPGIIKTPMTQRISDDEMMLAGALSRTPAGRFGDVDDIGAAVAYVASDAAGYMYGTVLTVDGGWNAA